MPWGIFKEKPKIKTKWSSANGVFSFISLVLVNAFPWNRHLCYWLEQSHTSCPLTLTLNFRFILSAMLWTLWTSVDTAHAENRCITTQALPPFVTVLERLPSVWVIFLFVYFLSLVPSFFPIPDHLINYISWFVFPRRVSQVAILLVQAELTIANKVRLWDLWPCTLPPRVHPPLATGWSPMSASQAHQSSTPCSRAPYSSPSPGPWLTSWLGHAAHHLITLFRLLYQLVLP